MIPMRNVRMMDAWNGGLIEDQGKMFIIPIQVCLLRRDAVATGSIPSPFNTDWRVRTPGRDPEQLDERGSSKGKLSIESQGDSPRLTPSKKNATASVIGTYDLCDLATVH
jgi:hypothetical protein